VAKLVDALGSGPSGGNTVEVRFLSWAPGKKSNALMINQGFFFFRTRLFNFFRHRPLQRRILDRPAFIVRQQTGPRRQSIIPPPVAARPRERGGPSCETAHPEDASAWSLIPTTASPPMLAACPGKDRNQPVLSATPKAPTTTGETIPAIFVALANTHENMDTTLPEARQQRPGARMRISSTSDTVRNPDDDTTGFD
jgi:hypothetical protein